MARLKAVSPAELVTAVHQTGRDRRYLATLAAEVVSAAADGDAVADRLLTDAAADLAEVARAAAVKAGLAGRSFPLALTGGLLLNSAAVRDRLVQRLTAAGLSPTPVTTVVDPARGAIVRARALAS
jgi:N-acetylglucosamine kinase-like BadF-type ATPase